MITDIYFYNSTRQKPPVLLDENDVVYPMARCENAIAGLCNLRLTQDKLTSQMTLQSVNNNVFQVITSIHIPQTILDQQVSIANISVYEFDQVPYVCIFKRKNQKLIFPDFDKLRFSLQDIQESFRLFINVLIEKPDYKTLIYERLKGILIFKKITVEVSAKIRTFVIFGISLKLSILT
jgi:hypothetical protein